MIGGVASEVKRLTRSHPAVQFRGDQRRVAPSISKTQHVGASLELAAKRGFTGSSASVVYPDLSKTFISGSTTEGAVRSGRLAAKAVCRALVGNDHFLTPDLDPEELMRLLARRG